VRPDDREIDDEIRGHLALSIKERIDQGEDPEAARLAALREFGYIPAARDSMRLVWYSRWFDAAGALRQDMRIGLRSLRRTKALAATVVVTLALGIGANAAIFSVVRGVLLRPLVNRDEDRLVYIRQSAPGLGAPNTTFSVPEIDDLQASVTTIASFGDFSTIEFTMVGFGDPRVVRAGVVSGSYFEVMGLRPVLGRLITAADDGPTAASVAVLTHRFWASSVNSDSSVIGRTVRLGSRSATVVGVLEPSVPYPADTEIIANVATSPHHLDATMAKGRTHRMTELFGRLAPGATLEGARAEITAVHAAMMRQHPESYSAKADVRVSVTPLRDQITAPARTILIVLLAAAAVVFVIACSNVANLILARSVRREGELAIRAALGASQSALRRTLLAESLVLCGAGAALGIALAHPLVAIVAQFASKFSIRALEVPVDSSLLWVGGGLAMSASVLLAYIPRLPVQAELGVMTGSSRTTPGTNRRLRVFATTQIAFSFVMLAAASTLVATLVAMQTAQTGVNMKQVIAFDLPSSSVGVRNTKELDGHVELARRIHELPGVEGVTLGTFVPWRDAGLFPRFQFTAEGYTPADGEENPHARFRIVAPNYFGVLGVPFIAGRDFTNEDRTGNEPVAIVSATLAQRLFPNGDAVNRKVWWTEALFGKPVPRRIVGVVADFDDENVVRSPTLAIYQPVQQLRVAGRLLVRAQGDPYALVPPIRKMVHEMSADQPLERAATLEDVRKEILAPDRLQAFVLTGFAGMALLIAVVGVAGVLAFSVSARTREFGVRLAVGASPRHILVRILLEGTGIVAIGIAAGAVGGFVFASLASGYIGDAQLPGTVPLFGAAVVLLSAAILASLMPAARAARVDVLQALRSE
jgi:putative ABC transport system permease protein